MSRFSDLPELENRLMAGLQPVRPDPQFRRRLEVRLQSSDQVTLEAVRQPMAGWILVAGLAVGILFLWLLRKN